MSLTRCLAFLATRLLAPTTRPCLTGCPPTTCNWIGRHVDRSTPKHGEFLPTNLPTANGSYSPFQRLGSPRRERKSLIRRVCLDCHGRGRGFESRRPRHSLQSPTAMRIANLLFFPHNPTGLYEYTSPAHRERIASVQIFVLLSALS